MMRYGSVLLISLVIAANADAAAEIEIWAGPARKRQFDAAEFESALRALSTNQTMRLRPGIVYPNVENAYKSQTDGVTLIGGTSSQVMIDAARDTFEYDSSFDETYFGNGQRIWFSGDVPSSLKAGDLYFVVAHDKSENTFKVSASQQGRPINIGMTPHGNRCVVHFTAILAPTNRRSYDYLLKFEKCRRISIQELFLTGGGENHATDGFGVGLWLEACDTSVALTGVSVTETRGAPGAYKELMIPNYNAWGIACRRCDEVTIVDCAGHNTGAYSIVVEGFQHAALENCATSDAFCRDFAAVQVRSSSHDKKSLSLKECYFTNRNNAMAAGDMYGRLSINLQFMSPVETVTFDQVFIDWRDLESKGNTWAFDFGENTVLLKGQFIDTWTIRDCEFLHGGNAETRRGNGIAATMKLDTEPVRSLRIVRSTLSGGIFDQFTESDSGVEELIVQSSRLQEHGRFGMDAPILYCEREVVVFGRALGSSVDNLIQHVGYCVIKMFDTDYVKLGPERRWAFAHTQVRLDPNYKGDRYWVYGHAATQTPPYSENGRNGVTFSRSTVSVERPRGHHFYFSEDDKTNIEN